MHTIHKVAKFHTLFNHPIATSPTPATQELRELRVKLIAEELSELCQALGVSLKLIIDVNHPYYAMVNITETKPDAEVNLVEAADALGDLDYVVQGANLVFGFPSEQILDIIQESNMSKLGEDGKPIYRKDGKVLKGPNYFPPTPKIKELLEGTSETTQTPAMTVEDCIFGSPPPIGFSHWEDWFTSPHKRQVYLRSLTEQELANLNKVKSVFDPVS